LSAKKFQSPLAAILVQVLEPVTVTATVSSVETVCSTVAFATSSVVFIATADAESSATVVQQVHTAVIARREAAMQPQLAVAKHLPKQSASTRSLITKVS
jgi:hypothetical protein